jgi:hypothetical protein
MVIARRALRRPPWGGRPAYRAGFCSSASAPPRPAGGRRAVADPVTRRGEFDECRFDLLDFGFGLFFQAHQRIPGGLVDPDQFVELELERLCVAILGVLDNEDHKKRHDRRARIDDELPGIGPVKEGPATAHRTTTRIASTKAVERSSCCSTQRAKLAKIERASVPSPS